MKYALQNASNLNNKDLLPDQPKSKISKVSQLANPNYTLKQ